MSILIDKSIGQAIVSAVMKSWHKATSRRLKDGKIVQVDGYYDKRTKKNQDTHTLNMFESQDREHEQGQREKAQNEYRKELVEKKSYELGYDRGLKHDDSIPGHDANLNKLLDDNRTVSEMRALVAWRKGYALGSQERKHKAEDKPDNAQRYYYRLTLRPPGRGTAPDGFKYERMENKGAWNHGSVSYDKPLTAEQISHFDLVPEPQQLKDMPTAELMEKLTGVSASKRVSTTKDDYAKMLRAYDKLVSGDSGSGKKENTVIRPNYGDIEDYVEENYPDLKMERETIEDIHDHLKTLPSHGGFFYTKDLDRVVEYVKKETIKEVKKDVERFLGDNKMHQKKEVTEYVKDRYDLFGVDLEIRLSVLDDSLNKLIEDGKIEYNGYSYGLNKSFQAGMEVEIMDKSITSTIENAVLKSWHKPTIRMLKNGKTVNVKGYSDKRTKKNDTPTGNFATGDNTPTMKLANKITSGFMSESDLRSEYDNLTSAEKSCMVELLQDRVNTINHRLGILGNPKPIYDGKK